MRHVTCYVRIHAHVAKRSGTNLDDKKILPFKVIKIVGCLVLTRNKKAPKLWVEGSARRRGELGNSGGEL